MDLPAFYHGHIDCLNHQDWPRLADFVGKDVQHNSRHLGLDGYRSMLIGDFEAIPDLAFNIEILACEFPTIASRLLFDCTPTGMLFSMPVNGRRVRFSENVFYRVQDGVIQKVWSVIDTTAIADQLRAAP